MTTRIDKVLRADRYDGFDCDNHLGPFLSNLRAAHNAYEARVAEMLQDDPDTTYLGDVDAIPWWRLIWGSAWA